MDLLEQAVALGDSIIKDARFVKMREAREKNDTDQELQSLMREFTVLRGDLMRESAKDDPDGEKMVSLDVEVNDLYAKIMSNANMQLYAQAQAECQEIITKMKRVLDFAFAGDDPEAALSEESGCGGSCGGCSGCS